MSQTCENCHHKRPLAAALAAVNPRGPHGRCHRFPPVRIQLVVGIDTRSGTPDISENSDWPLISNSQSCGEWTPKSSAAMSS